LKVPVGFSATGHPLYYYVEYRKKLDGFDFGEFASESQGAEYELLVRHSGIDDINTHVSYHQYPHRFNDWQSSPPLDLETDFVDEYRDVSFSVISAEGQGETSSFKIQVNTPRTSISPARLLTFDNSEEREQSFALNNISQQSLTISALNLVGRSASSFEVIDNACANRELAPSESCNVTLKRIGEISVLAGVKIEMNNGEIKQLVELSGLSMLDLPAYDPSLLLEWQNPSETYGENLNWAESFDYCKSLTLQGKSDWRLPLIDELLASFFKLRGEPLYQFEHNFWSISEPSNFKNAFYIVGNDNWLNTNKDNKHNALCVRNN